MQMPTSRVTFVAHTHWDREWYHPFEVFRARLVEVIDEALEVLERDPAMHFTLDGHVALVDDYLELRPLAEPRLRALVAAGRLHIGPWYTQADSLLTDGEALVRNLAWGIRRADELGGHMPVGYMADQFGHAAQLPQLFRQLGIAAAVLWRGVGPERPPHAFKWLGPDGSDVTAVWLHEGYATGRLLPSDPAGFSDAVERALTRHAEWLGTMPLVIPVGDDHVRIADWLPAAAEELRKRRPEMQIEVGGFRDHLPHLAESDFTVRGELRSPAFSPVLAGTASARIREKQAAAKATALLLRYAEPLAAWCAFMQKPVPYDLLTRAWRHLLHNQAHDSAAGCGVDEAHEDVKARYRWAEQLAGAVRDQSLAQLRGRDRVTVFTPSAAPLATVELEIPRALQGDLVARGPDGVARPVQTLGAVDERPLFEGEFAAAELAVYLGGLDPKTPLFGRYLTGITARPDVPGTIRLDVGLGERPVSPAKLAEDQKQVERLLGEAERFKVVLHASGTTRRVLAQVSPAVENGFVPVTVEPGSVAAPAFEGRAGKHDRGIFAGPLRVTVEDDGALAIDSGAHHARFVLLDEGDRGDLYHFDPVAGDVPLRPRLAGWRVTEEGPLRARLVLEQELELPSALAPDRVRRGDEKRTCTLLTEVTVTAGERLVELATTFTNDARDHRLRAAVSLPFSATALDADQGLAVVDRPLSTEKLGAGVERPAPTGQHQRFVDVSDGRRGLALLSRGLPEHEVRVEDGATTLSLTLLRAVGWLARGDLSCVDHAVGPMVETPGAQEPGLHRFEFALSLHGGDWESAGVLAEARRFQAPPLSMGGGVTVPPGRGLVDVAGATVSALYPSPQGLVLRILNPSSHAAEVVLTPAQPPRRASLTDPLERPLEALPIADGKIRLTLGPHKLATILLAP
jgi:2-O-(6-phospho-alpha-D-mannosyl)-D-glycerate hydrolase